MIKSIFIKSSILIFLSVLYTSNIFATSNNKATNIKVPIIFSDNMVLQRDKNISVWGWAEPDAQVFVEIAGQKKSTVVSKEGNWKIELIPMSAGGPHEMKIFGVDTITCENVMVGEVWFCSGQSNMEMTLTNCNNYKEEVISATYPNIRLFQVNRITSNQPLNTINGDGWSECCPETIPNFSAVAYFFGRELFKELNVPIGLINSSWGGTPAEAWTSGETLKKIPDFKNKAETIESTLNEHLLSIEDYEAEMKLREEKIILGDAGFDNGKYVWNNPNLDLQGWNIMNLPTKWEKAGYPNLDGIMWFRKEIIIPDSMIGSDLILNLGPINDIDITWFNGVKVGGLRNADIVRRYKIPKSLVKHSKNVIAVNVHDIGFSGGLWGNADQLYIESSNGSNLSLAGDWFYKIGFDTKELGPKPQNPNDPNRPTVLFNSMLHPFINYAIQGAIWYQGEANASRAYQYQTLFPAMIKDWRSKWNLGDFTFLFVQLANFMELQTEPKDDDWAELREAQLKTLSLPNTGMAVTIDIGDAEHIHPKNKQDVGKRLALNALNLVYKQNVEYSGPIYKKKTVEGNKIRLFFEHSKSGLTTLNNEELKGFTIAASDKKFYWAKAKIEGNSIVVWNDEIENPKAVRYAWASNPICNLYNNAGLPASPFRTDTWPGITEGIK